MKVKLIKEGAKIPTRADDGAAGYDLYVPQDTLISPGRNIVKLGLCIQIDKGWEGHIRPRSGFSAKGMVARPYDTKEEGIIGLIPVRINADVIQGTIDSSFTGEIGAIVNNHSDNQYVIERGTRIAQMVIEQCYQGELESVTELDETDRGDGGFGHSGTK